MRRKRYRQPEPIGDLLPGVLRDLRPRRAGLLQRVRAAWADVVGERVAAKSRIASLDEGVVRVELESAPLKQHLSTFQGGKILEELKRRVPEARLKGVRYAVGRLS